jgi:hypothetical protein
MHGLSIYPYESKARGCYLSVKKGGQAGKYEMKQKQLRTGEFLQSGKICMCRKGGIPWLPIV